MAFKRKFLEFQRFLENISGVLFSYKKKKQERERERLGAAEAKKLQFDLHKDPAIP